MRSMNRRDPAPSRLSFRLKRLWRSARFRRAATVWAPTALVLGGIGWAASQEHIRTEVMAQYEAARETLSARPEFAIQRVLVQGASAERVAEIEARLAHWRGASSLEADVVAVRDEIAALRWVTSAKVRLEAPESLIVTVTERQPVAVWRRGDERLLIDKDGRQIGILEADEETPNLPLIAGQGAPAAVREARALVAAAGDLAPRLRGLVRVGERRWDAILEDGPRIMLPARGAVDAMGYLLALEAGEGVLHRDLAAIDLRLRARPTLRLNPDAAEALRALRTPRKPGEDA